MPELFIEFFGEEIPARMQANAQEHLGKILKERLLKESLIDERKAKIKTWSSPRRLAVAVDEVLLAQPDIEEERLGPRTNAPEQAIKGFLASAGIERKQAKTKTTDKGEFLVAEIKKKGEGAEKIIPKIIESIIANFHWQKSMRWGDSDKSWVRPLHNIVVLFNGKRIEGKINFGDGVVIKFSDSTFGHRVLSPQSIKINSASQYVKTLENLFVLVAREQRKIKIKDALKKFAKSKNLNLIEDEALLEEVVGLVEYPNVIIGSIDKKFIALSEEITITAMKNHQKYFAFKNSKGELAPYFASVADIKADGKSDATIRTGNERVLRARLADAEFSLIKDIKDFNEDEMTIRLEEVTFYDELGSMMQKTKRIEKIATQIAETIKASDKDKAIIKQAAQVSRTDLASHTVREFPELQGYIGGYLAWRAGGETEHSLNVGMAVDSSHRPQGPDDTIPDTLPGCVVALADKIDTLIGFFGIEQIPSGSRDPFALRRAALGVIRIIIESEIALPLNPVFKEAILQYRKTLDNKKFPDSQTELLAFIHDRLKVWLRDKRLRYDIADAVIGAPIKHNDNLLHLYELANTLTELLASREGKALLGGYKRIANILTKEEKKDKKQYNKQVKEKLFTEKSEHQLYSAIKAIEKKPFNTTEDALHRMRALGSLHKAIDRFFDEVKVNSDDKSVRENRLNLLGYIREAMAEIADFSAIVE